MKEEDRQTDSREGGRKLVERRQQVNEGEEGSGLREEMKRY